jgi:hypothetical protein
MYNRSEESFFGRDQFFCCSLGLFFVSIVVRAYMISWVVGWMVIVLSCFALIVLAASLVFRYMSLLEDINNDCREFLLETLYKLEKKAKKVQTRVLCGRY